jgi:hypothetical protein
MVETKEFIKINADELRRHDPQQAAIHGELCRIGREITARINEAHRSRRTGIRYDLPYIFNIPEMDSKKAELPIYSGIIDSLKKQKYIVQFIEGSKPPAPPAPQLVIRWSTAASRMAQELMQKVLLDASHESPSSMRTSKLTPVKLSIPRGLDLPELPR